MRDIGIVLFMVLPSVLIIIPGQLLLCVKTKKLIFKLLPAILLAAATLGFTVMAFSVNDWSALLWLILAAFAGAYLLADGLAWLIWAISKGIKKQKTEI